MIASRIPIHNRQTCLGVSTPVEMRRTLRLFVTSTGVGIAHFGSSPRPSQGLLKSSKPGHILIVDDDPGMAETLIFILETEGYLVTVAENGSTAIELVRQENFDLILMDVKLPGMNGVEAYKAIKRVKPNSKAVMITAYALENLIQEALREGALSIFHKPLDIPALLEFIRQTIRS